ncbi:unnamed protein product [Somion occarium]|uniref:Uncharacterized protein n=1 Tax=Somion occarium TaxID=3059160 RepID=A0ABP1CPQ5_9APHY
MTTASVQGHSHHYSPPFLCSLKLHTPLRIDVAGSTIILQFTPSPSLNYPTKLPECLMLSDAVVTPHRHFNGFVLVHVEDHSLRGPVSLPYRSSFIMTLLILFNVSLAFDYPARQIPTRLAIESMNFVLFFPTSEPNAIGRFDNPGLSVKRHWEAAYEHLSSRIRRALARYWIIIPTAAALESSELMKVLILGARDHIVEDKQTDQQKRSTVKDERFSQGCIFLVSAEMKIMTTENSLKRDHRGPAKSGSSQSTIFVLFNIIFGRINLSSRKPKAALLSLGENDHKQERRKCISLDASFGRKASMTKLLLSNPR